MLKWYKKNFWGSLEIRPVSLSEDTTSRIAGRNFRNLILESLDFCRNHKRFLIINMDGTYGYSSAFLEEAFQGLGASMNELEIICSDEPYLIQEIETYI